MINMNIHIIYKFTFSNNKVYIGQTILKFNQRINKYKTDSKNKKSKDYNRLINKAIRKYGWNNVQKEILCTVTEEFVDDAERYFIKKYKSNNKRFGYNLESGGNKNKHHSEETKKLMSKLKKGKFVGEKNSQYGKKRPDVSERNKNNSPMLGKKQSNKTIEKKVKARQKSINIYVKSGEYIKTFESIKQASNELNIFSQNICAVLKGKYKSAGGYIFKYN